MRWDYVIMALACLNCFMVPLEIAVEIAYQTQQWYNTLNIVIDTIFIVDVLVNFNTTFMLGYDVIYDRKLIAR